jgi:hypothetical protein
MIKIFTDKDTQTVVESLDLGRVDLGKTIKYTMYMKNTDVEWPMNNIHIENTNPELRFEYPEYLQANEVKEINIFWTPKLNSRKPLDTKFKFTGDILIG